MRILIADDEPVSRCLLQSVLAKWGYEVIVACHGKEAWQILNGTNAPRLAILDWMMPGMDGPEICQAVRRKDSQTYIYLLLLTSRHKKQDIIQGLESGADDYLIKPLDGNELRARLLTGRRILDWQEQLLKAREALREQATKDSLTGIWNRCTVLELMERELAQTAGDRPLGVIMLDIDHFKRINDTFGHLAGDRVLREVARRLGDALKPQTGLGRYGGEEFLVYLPQCGAAQTRDMGEWLRRAIAAHPVALTEGVVPVTISVGTTVSSKRIPSLYLLLNSADAALYRAKYGGRNRVEYCHEVVGPESINEMRPSPAAGDRSTSRVCTPPV